jgi:endo-1,4-beta-xylanase
MTSTESVPTNMVKLHFGGQQNNGRTIWVDSIIVTRVVLPGRKPVVVEAESGTGGSNYSVLQSDGVTYISPTTNNGNLTYPGDSSRIKTYQVTFADSGSYNLFARIRVGANNFNDDSFFYGHGFGIKDTASADNWYMVNGLASAGFSDAGAFVDGPGSLGSGVWKWINITKNVYNSKGDSFYVSMDSLTRIFQIAGREDGLDIDKLAFGKTYLFFTVNNLDSVQAGSSASKVVDTSLIYKGPALAAGQYKFLGNVPKASPENTFTNYWTQLTPENAGKWAYVAVSTDTTQWNWSGLDAQYNYAVNNNLVYKHHTLIWGAQQPTWINGLDSATQYNYIETWIRNVGQRYPKIDMVDVVNEPLYGHNPPDGENGRANYIKALGGTGTTGWDWLINSFKLARKYLPNAKLLINEYGIINDNSATTSYIQIINLLTARNLIDGIGVQGHRFELEGGDTTTFKNNLDRLAAGTGLPVYISEFDLGNIGDSGTPDDNQQLQLYQKIFPVLWRHPAVKGITLWGYLPGMWQATAYLINSDGTVRPAFTWLAQFVKNNPTGVEITNSGVPSAYQLEQNYPNPFNPATNIRYNISKTSQVTLKVFDILGRQVQTLENTLQTPGQYTVTFNAQNFASGIYFYQLQAGTFTATKKLMLLK